MRRFTTLLYVLPVLLTLSGCNASLASDRHDVERLLLIQTMGLDREEDQLVMSVSSGLGPDDAPALVMSTPAFGIEDAIAKLQNYSPENQLFYAHVQYLLLGEEAARQDLTNVIAWVDRSPTLRMDTDLLVVRGTAEDAVVNASEQSTDITQRLASLDRQSRSVGWTIYTLREAAAALAEGGGALCLAVRTVPTDETIFTDEMRSDAVIPTGYAILSGSGLTGFLSPEESLGAELLTGDPTGLLITVDGNTLEVLEGTAELEGEYAPDGTPTGIAVRCTLRTGVLEKTPGGAGSPEEMDAALSETVGQWVSGALEQARNTRCDFLGLKKAVLTSSRAMASWGEDWTELFPELPVRVTVDGIVDRSYDSAE